MRVLLELFVDDGMLALALLAVVALAALVAWATPGTPMAGGVVLLFGCLGTLLINVITTERKRP